MSPVPLAPSYELRLDGDLAPSGLRASISSLSATTALEGADQVELTLVNLGLRWLDEPLLEPGTVLELAMGIAPDRLAPVFAGTIVAVEADLPSSGVPTLRVTAHDRRESLRDSKHARLFSLDIGIAVVPQPDPMILSLLCLEHGLIPSFDPISGAVQMLIGGGAIAEAVLTGNQKGIRQQKAHETDEQFLKKIVAESGWEMVVDHSPGLGGRHVVFFSPMERVEPTLTLRWGESLVSFTPRITEVGRLDFVTAPVPVPMLKSHLEVTIGWDWDAMGIYVKVRPLLLGGLMGESGKVSSLPTPGARALEPEPTTSKAKVGKAFQEVMSATEVARKLLAKLLPNLNKRLTGSASTIGDPRIQAGVVVRLDGLGKRFGGLYRVTKAQHSLDEGGYQTRFEVRKELWFSGIPDTSRLMTAEALGFQGRAGITGGGVSVRARG